MARVQRKAMIPSMDWLAKRVIDLCMVCRQRKWEMNRQTTEDLPTEKLSWAAPFF